MKILHLRMFHRAPSGDSRAAVATLRAPRRRYAWLATACALLLALGAVGCGEAKVPVVPVTGNLTVGNEIPVGAHVVLHAKGHALPPGVAPTGRVAKDGSFKLSIYGDGEGVPAGEYVATVEWYKIIKGDTGESISGPNVIPRKYGSPATSPIRITVKPEPTVLEPIVIR